MSALADLDAILGAIINLREVVVETTVLEEGRTRDVIEKVERVSKVLYEEVVNEIRVLARH
jgi:hypothetical protein